MAALVMKKPLWKEGKSWETQPLRSGVLGTKARRKKHSLLKTVLTDHEVDQPTCHGIMEEISIILTLTWICSRQRTNLEAWENTAKCQTAGSDCAETVGLGTASFIGANCYSWETSHEEINAIKYEPNGTFFALLLNCWLYGTSCWTVWKKSNLLWSALLCLTS